MHSNYRDLMKVAEAECRGDLTLLPTILKEMIHYDLLYAVSRTPDLSRHLVFHGGTALRLCHSSTRLSEDLDFCCGNDEAFEMLDSLVGQQFADLMESQYGLEVRWDQKKPIHFDNTEDGVVRRWQARVYIPVPGSRTNMTHAHRINVEVSKQKSFDNSPLRVRCNYPHLAAGYREMLIRTASTQEILVDKILAITNRLEIKSRDIWDIDMLLQSETTFRPELFTKRFAGPECEGWRDRLTDRIGEMLTPEQLKKSSAELGRFVRKGERELLEDIGSGYLTRMIERTATYLERVVRAEGKTPLIGHRALTGYDERRLTSELSP